MHTYRLSAAGRRLNLALLGGALVIWFFALWSFGSTLGLEADPQRFWASVQGAFAAGLGVGRVIPALLMFVLIVATPLLIWNLMLEWAASYTPAPDGLRFVALGVDLLVPWATIQAVHAPDDDRDEPYEEIGVTIDLTAQIANPLFRRLYRQAYGRRRLPIYAGLDQREQLLTTIREQAGLPLPEVEAAPAVDAAR